MQFKSIQGRDISEAWFLLLSHCLKKGRVKNILTGASAGEQQLELDFVFVEIFFPATLPFIPIVPEGFPAVAQESDMAALAAAMTYNYQLKPGHLYYGFYLEPQLKYAIDQYKRLGYDLNEMCFLTSNVDNLWIPDPWVLKVVDTKIQDGKLCLIAYVRGLDIWQGFIIFAGALQMLKQYMASEIGCEDGELYMAGKSFCLPAHQQDLAKRLTKVRPNNYVSNFE